MRRLPVLAILALAGGPLLLGGCRQSKVHVAFRPPVGAQYRYEVKVSKVVTVRLGNERPDRSVDQAVLHVDNTVLASGPEGVRMQVVLRRANSPDRTFVMRFDRAAQLAGVEAVEGLPPAVLGSDTFPEFLPAAATAPPDRPLAPGERWKINAETTVQATAPARLVGTGRLIGMREVGGRKVASIRAETRLPGLSSVSRLRQGTFSLSGEETTRSESARSVVDGVVEEATSVTTGKYDATLSAPSGDSAPPIEGTVIIEVRSETRRLRAEPPSGKT